MCCFYLPANFTKALSYIVNLEKKEQQQKKRKKKLFVLFLFFKYICFLILDIFVVLFDLFYQPTNFTKTLPYTVSLKIAYNNQ